MDPIDEALQAKEANFFASIGKGALGTDFSKSFASGMGEATGGALTAAVAFGASQMYDSVRKGQDFRAMLELHPDLAERQKEDPKFFNVAYNSLRTLNPTYGEDPIVAGSLMRRMMESRENAGTILTSTLKPPQAAGRAMSIDHKMGPLKIQRGL